MKRFFSLDNIKNQNILPNVSEIIEENQNQTEENEANNEVSQKSKPLEKPFHLRHDLNQLCFEKRERKNVDRFGFGEKSTEKKSEKKLNTPSKNKKEKIIQKNTSKSTVYKKKNEKKPIKIISPPENNINQNNTIEKEDNGCAEMKEKKEEELKEDIEKNQNIEKNIVIKDHAEKNLNQENSASTLQETVSISKINSETNENSENKQNENTENNDLNNQHIDLETTPDLIKPSNIINNNNNRKIPQNKSPMPFIRKRGRKKKGRWGNKLQGAENNSSNVTNSLNKIFKKNVKKVAFSSQNKRVVMQHNIETSNIFTNIYQEIFNTVEIKPEISLNNNNCLHENGETQNENGVIMKEKKLFFVKIKK